MKELFGGRGGGEKGKGRSREKEEWERVERKKGVWFQKERVGLVFFSFLVGKIVVFLFPPWEKKS